MRNYETTWYVLRRAAGETFPDGFAAPAKCWATRKPIWINLGGKPSWKLAITFGPSKHELRKAAEAFGAKEIVWLEEDVDFYHGFCDYSEKKERG